MVAINSEPLESLPYLDVSITPEERQAVELLIQNERPHDTTALHHRVHDLLPLSSHSATSILMHDIQRYEDDEDDEDIHNEEPRQILSDGISMDRYAEFGHGDDVHYSEMYTALSYSMLRERNSLLTAQNARQLRENQRAHLASLSELDRVYQEDADRKRQRVDEANEERKRRQLDFEPVNGYLEQRWHDGIRSMVDLGIQRAQE